MTSALADLQSFFATAIRQPVPVAEQAGSVTETPVHVAGNGRLSPTGQLEIYREQFWLRHVGALEEDFATIHHLLGHDAFHTLAERYVAAHPPVDFSLRDLGARLPEFIASHPDYASDPLIADCARLEWAFVDAFDAADASPLDASSIASIPEDAWPAARVTLHPSVQRVALAHPAHELRAAVRGGTEAPRPVPSPTHVVVYRGPETLQYVAIEAAAFDLLGRLARGESLGDACEALAAEHPEVDLEAKVGEWFQAWTSYGWVSTVTV